MTAPKELPFAWSGSVAHQGFWEPAAADFVALVPSRPLRDRESTLVRGLAKSAGAGNRGIPQNVARRVCQHSGLTTALFGGTFDPIHDAHLTVARAARDAFALDQVLLVPASAPPHKTNRITEPWKHRYRMVQLACAGEDRLHASDLESGSARSYSIDTIERFRQTMSPGDRLFFLIGADAFSEIRTWRLWEEVVSLVEFIVVTRPGHDYDVPPNARVWPLASISLAVSSSRIREQLARCERPEELPPAVFEYIRRHRLYGYGSACPPVQERADYP